MKFNYSLEGGQNKIRELEQLGQGISLELSQAGKQTAMLFVTNAQNYPVPNSGNRPPIPYWIRGVGRIQNKSGFINPPSQQLKDSWDWASNGMVTDIWNTASYAPYVHSRTRQTRFHEEHMWPTTDEILENIGFRGISNEQVFENAVRPIRVDDSQTHPFAQAVRKIKDWIRRIK